LCITASPKRLHICVNKSKKPLQVAGTTLRSPFYKGIALSPPLNYKAILRSSLSITKVILKHTSIALITETLTLRMQTQYIV